MVRLASSENLCPQTVQMMHVVQCFVRRALLCARKSLAAINAGFRRPVRICFPAIEQVWLGSEPTG